MKCSSLILRALRLACVHFADGRGRDGQRRHTLGMHIVLFSLRRRRDRFPAPVRNDMPYALAPPIPRF